MVGPPGFFVGYMAEDHKSRLFWLEGSAEDKQSVVIAILIG